jgi:hypothetical protein
VRVGLPQTAQTPPHQVGLELNHCPCLVSSAASKRGSRPLPEQAHRPLEHRGRSRADQRSIHDTHCEDCADTAEGDAMPSI